jgi:hypothetical protein
MVWGKFHTGFRDTWWRRFLEVRRAVCAVMTLTMNYFNCCIVGFVGLKKTVLLELLKRIFWAFFF